MQLSKWFIFFLCLAGMISCKKESQNSGSPDISGNWAFTGIQNTTTVTTVDTGNGHKTEGVVFYSYNSGQTRGVITITGDSIVGLGVGYSCNMFERETTTIDGVVYPADSITIPTLDTTVNSLVKFEYIGKDSMHYFYGTLVGTNGSGTSLTTGAKFSLTGDILTLTSEIFFLDTTLIAPYPLGLRGTVVVTFERR